MIHPSVGLVSSIMKGRCTATTSRAPLYTWTIKFSSVVGGVQILFKMVWRCSVCFVFVALSLSNLLSHINIMHSRSPDFHVLCGIDGCIKDYRVYNSYYYHIKRNHASHLIRGTDHSHHGTDDTTDHRIPLQDAHATSQTCPPTEHSTLTEMEGSSTDERVSYSFCERCLVV